MTRLTRLLILLYPPKWRQRYESEFAALLQDMGPLGRHAPDLIWGAMKMQMKEWGFLRLALAFAAVGLLVAVGFQVATPDRYVSKSVAHVADLDDLSDREAEVLSRRSLSQIIQEQNLYQSERDRQPLEDVIENMRTRDIRVRPLSSDSFSIEFTYRDPAIAQKTVHRLMYGFTSGGAAALIHDASPSEPSGRSRSLILSIGVTIGLFLGLLVWGIFQLTPRTQMLLAGCGAGGALVCFAASFLLPEVYISTAVMRSVEKGMAVKLPVQDAEIADIAGNPQLYGDNHDGRVPIETLMQRFRKNLSIENISSPGGRDTVRISFSCNTPRCAQLGVVSLTGGWFSDDLAARRKRVQVLDHASLPASPASPNRAVLASIGLGIGLLAGALLSRRKSGGINPEPSSAFPAFEA